MVSDSDLIERLRELLSMSDLNSTITALVRRRLEEDFGIDLSDRMPFISEQVDVYLQSQFENAAQENEEEINDKGVQDVEEDDEEEEEEKTSMRSRKTEEVKIRGDAFTKFYSLFPELQKFRGAPNLARIQSLKLLWKYIRENNLQDPSNRRRVICDGALRYILSADSIDMFQIVNELTKNIRNLDSDGASVGSSAPKEKQRKQARDEGPIG